MKKLSALLVGLTLSASAAAASPRLALWITEPIGATNGTQCNLQTSFIPKELSTMQPTLTEQDITAWDTVRAIWTLNSARFDSNNDVFKLQDHCFVLSIDGKLISSGVVLSAHSARWIGFPTLRVYDRGGEVNLQLISSNQSSNVRPIHVDALDAVLGRRTSVGAGKK